MLLVCTLEIVPKKTRDNICGDVPGEGEEVPGILVFAEAADLRGAGRQAVTQDVLSASGRSDKNIVVVIGPPFHFEHCV